ncbi:MAG: YdcF family protein [Lachnospiraceae bacterium]
MGVFWLILGAVCLIYYIVCVSYAGFGTAFAFVWAIGACIFFMLATICTLAKKEIIMIPVWLKITFWTVFAICLVAFLIFEVCVIKGMMSKPEKDCEFVIVLGAQIRGTRVTKSLAKRLDAAYEYYRKNPDVTIIVSGGRGRGEDVTEAEAMADYLEEKGVPSEKILKEDKSTDTNENLLYSIRLIQDKNAKVAIATSNFHIFRAIHIAKAKGLVNVSGIPAESDEILFINYCVREAVGIAKDWAFGNFN